MCVFPINVICGNTTIVFYLINFDDTPNIQEIDASSIYESESNVFKRMDSIITCINLYIITQGYEENSNAFIRNKIRADFNSCYSIALMMYIEIAEKLTQGLVIECLKGLSDVSIKLSLKYSTYDYLSTNLNSLLECSKGLSGDDRVVILIAYLGKLYKQLPNNVYLKNICGLIPDLFLCDQTLLSNAPEEVNKWYNHATKNDTVKSTAIIPQETRFNLFENTYINPAETDKEKATRAINEYYSNDTMAHQHDWHEKWKKTFKIMFPNSHDDISNLITEFTLLAFTVEEETYPEFEYDYFDMVGYNDRIVSPLSDDTDLDNIFEQDYDPEPSNSIWELD